MDTTYKTTPARPAFQEAGPCGRSGEGSGSLMEQLVQQESRRAAQRPVDPAAPAVPEEPGEPPQT